MIRFITFFILLVSAALFGTPVELFAAGAPSSADAAAFRRESAELIGTALRKIEVVPSVTLTVVVGDETVVAEGYGTADRENGIPSDGDVLYYIASSTKPFTALAAALLDRRGAIALDDPLAEHLHGVSLDPALQADRVRLRDLLTHTSGIDNPPIAARLALTGEHDPATLWRLLGSSVPAEDAPLGNFLYTNVGYNIMGMIIDRETGKRWQDHLRDEIFDPLGMARTTAYASEPVRRGWPKAAPYFGVHPQGIQRVYLEKSDETMQSAGGMLTTARDIARFLEMELCDGVVDGRRVVPAEVVRETQRKLVEAEGGHPPFGRAGYGLGWNHGAWLDRPVLYHDGSFPGFYSSVSFMPDEGIGVAVFANDAFLGSRLAGALSVWAYDWWLGVPGDERAAGDMIAQIEAMRPVVVEKLAADFDKRAEREWQLSLPREAYTGSFTNELCGTLNVELKEGRFVVSIGRLRCVATPFTEPETMRVELMPQHGVVLRFETVDGRVDHLVWDDAVYRRTDGAGEARAGYR